MNDLLDGLTPNRPLFPPVQANGGNDNVITGPWSGSGEGANSESDSKEQCPADDDDTDCKEWRELLILQGDAILANFQSAKLSLADFNKLVKEHNQAVDFYIIECKDPSAETALKL